MTISLCSMNRRFTLTILALFAAFALNAQNVSDLIITEAMVDGENSVVDDYGRKDGWIEIFNNSQGTVNFGGCFLTDDPNDLKKSLIPKTDLRTTVGPRQSVIFYASGRGEDGTFYAGFKVRRGSTIYLVSNDGRTIVDSLEIPEDLPEGMSVSKFAEDIKGMDWEVSSTPTEPSPGIMNGDQNAETNAQKMAREDPHGFILTIVSVAVVFAALAILWFLFWLFFDRKANKKSAPKAAVMAKSGDKKMSPEVAAAIAMALNMENGGEVYAAIATALHLYLADTAHDSESFVITIRPNEASGWKYKGRNFRHLPNKN